MAQRKRTKGGARKKTGTTRKATAKATKKPRKPTKPKPAPVTKTPKKSTGRKRPARPSPIQADSSSGTAYCSATTRRSTKEFVRACRC